MRKILFGLVAFYGLLKWLQWREVKKLKESYAKYPAQIKGNTGTTKNGQTITHVNIFGADQKIVRAQILSTLMDAFFTDPGMMYLVPDPEQRKQFQKRYFNLMIRNWPGRIYEIAGYNGVAVWTRCEAENVETLPFLMNGGWRLMMYYEMVIQVSVFQFFENFERTREKYLPNIHHYYYLADLGVAPIAQGQGLGSMLLEHMLKNYVDVEDLPCYLESSTESSMRLYQRHGFKVMEKVVMPTFPNRSMPPPTIYVMLRPRKSVAS